jgi:hypothetical protein
MITINVSITASCEASDVPAFITDEDDLIANIKESINYSLSRLDLDDVTFNSLTIEGYVKNE